ncbi:MAG: hypothetical protein FWG66_00775 [Spirochaetes bacterium]|nr:hypothetical protein [Spirochaetota bacterium]
MTTKKIWTAAIPLLLSAAIFFASCQGGAAPGPAAPADDNMAHIQARIAERILQFVTPLATPGFDAHVWDEARLETIDLFITVFNNRANLVGTDFHFDTGEVIPADELRAYALELLHHALGNLEIGFGDSIDARAAEMARMVAFMTLAVLSAAESQPPDSFIESAKAIVYGNIWFGYPARYNIVSLLDILLVFDFPALHAQPRQVILARLTALESYLNEVYSPDDFARHEHDREFVASLIAEMQAVVTGN